MMNMEKANELMKYKNINKEELLLIPQDFPYVMKAIDFSDFRNCFVPWHWHNEIEIFYMKSGGIEYYLPGGRVNFPAGTVGIINSNVLHKTRPYFGMEKDIQLIHLVTPSFLAGEQGSRIEQKYITPLVNNPQFEFVKIAPGDKKRRKLYRLIRKSFELKDTDFGYELKLRNILAQIWLEMYALSDDLWADNKTYSNVSDKIKAVIVYINEHYAEKISVKQLATVAFVSERECFRLFQECLHMTPIEYIVNYRLQNACRMLAGTQESVTKIAQSCGLGSSSYFGKIFREKLGCTPSQYRAKWRNSDKKRRI